MRVLTIILGILLTILGLYCMFTPGITFLSVGWIIGLLLLITGVNSIVDYFGTRALGFSTWVDLLFGIVTALLGLVLLFNQGARFITDMVAVYLLAAWILVGGIFLIAASLNLRKVGAGWVWMLVLGILSAIVGFLAFVYPGITAIAIGLMIGLFILLEGVSMILWGASMDKRGTIAA